MAYWIDRLDKQADILYNVTAQDTQERLVKAYVTALDDTKRDIEKLYDKLLIDAGKQKISVNDFYKYNRYFELRNQLNSKLTSLGKAEILIYDENLLRMYNNVQDLITKIAPGTISNSYIEQQSAQKVLDSVWCSDGKHWSDRVWNNKNTLQQQIEKGLLDSIIRGIPKDEVVKQISLTFNNGFNAADRITRTELTYVQNEATADRYKVAGIEQYQVLAAIDSRTSDICKELNMKVFNFTDKKVGENFPPLHPYCRSTIIPVIKGG